MSKKKTKMCSNIINRGSCLHGTKCFFAHSLSEITPNTCGYGENCIHIKINSKNRKLCSFIHPSETISSYHERIQKETNNLNSLKMFDFVTSKEEKIPCVCETFTFTDVKEVEAVFKSSEVESIIPKKVTLPDEKQQIPEWILIGAGNRKENRVEKNQKKFLELHQQSRFLKSKPVEQEVFLQETDTKKEVESCSAEPKEKNIVKVVVLNAEDLLNEASSWLDESISEVRVSILYKQN